MTATLPPQTALLTLPHDAGYDEARAAWNLSVDQRPAAVALPESAEDVVAVVRSAREMGLRVAAQGTGHNAMPLGDLSDTVLIKTHRMRGVTIDAPNRVARVEAGAQWGDVIGPAAAHGLACLHGSAPSVGVVGYTLGGGMSFLGRRYGTAASRVLAMDVVLADGSLVRADRRENTDLFDAMRGGGGAFGIVTAMEFELFEPGPIQAGHLWFPLERGREVFKAWAEWAPTLPETAMTIARILNVPDMDGPPPHLRGKSFALIETVVLGEAAEADALLAPVRALNPEMDTTHTSEIANLQHLHMDPPQPVPGQGDHQCLATFDAAAVDALFDSVTPSLLGFQVTLAGGRLAQLGGPYLTFGVGIAGTPGLTETLAAVRDALAGHATGRHYLNFAEAPAEGIWDADTHARLRAVKAQVDPEGVIRSNHPV